MARVVHGILHALFSCELLEFLQLYLSIDSFEDLFNFQVFVGVHLLLFIFQDGILVDNLVHCGSEDDIEGLRALILAFSTPLDICILRH